MKKIKKRHIAIAIVAIGAIVVTIEWNNLVVKDFNLHIKNALRMAEIESGSTSDYMSLGPNMVVNYSGQVENKGEIYKELLANTNELLYKNGITVGNEIIKVDFDSIKIMSGIKYYPVEIYTIENGVNKNLAYSFYISLDGNLIPTNNKIAIDSNVNMINTFTDNPEINQSYDLTKEEISNYNNNKDFSEGSKKLYYKLCEMAKLNIFGTTYINGYNFVVNMINPISYNGSEYYEIYMYNIKNKSNENGGLLYKFYMTASGNIISYNEASPTNAKSASKNNNEQTENDDNTSKVDNNSNKKSVSITKGLNKNLTHNAKINKTMYNNLYKLSLEYEGVLTDNKEYNFDIVSTEKINNMNYYTVKFMEGNTLIDQFNIADNGSITRKNK